jgi:RHS repeat-associated protein
MTRGGQTYYFHTNAHGDIISVTDSSKNRIATYSYDPWGKLTSSTGTLENPFRYAGYYYDSETGLYYLQARYYKADIYRFLTKDPDGGDVREPLSLNSYLYCVDNPVNNVDPDGHWGSDLHYSMTLSIARAFKKLKKWATLIARGSWTIDFSILGGAHFDIPFGGNDSRRAFAEQKMSEAIWLAKQGLWSRAMFCLGQGVHAMQDVYAHIGSWTKHSSKWDNPKHNKKGWRKARDATRSYLARFLSGI